MPHKMKQSHSFMSHRLRQKKTGLRMRPVWDVSRGSGMRSCVIFILLGFWAAEVAMARGGPADGLVEALGSPDAAARISASRKLVEAGADAVAPLLRTMDGKDHTAGKMAFETLFRIAQQAAGTNRQEALAATLSGELRSEHTLSTRRNICRLLAFVGDEGALPGLYQLLGDAELQEMAKFAICSIPGQAATGALVAALQISEPPFLLGVIYALGERGDRRAVPALEGGTRTPEAVIRPVVLAALSTLPDPLAVTAIRQAIDANEPGAIDALLTLGVYAGERGRPDLVRSVPEGVSAQPQLSDQQYCRLLYLLPYGDPESAAPDVFGKLLTTAAPKGPRQLGCLLDALSRVPGPKATTAIAALLQDARRQTILRTTPVLGESDLFIALLGVLGKRGETMTDDAASVVLAAMHRTEEPIRQAAIQAIEQGGILAGVEPLIGLLSDGASPIREAAEHALNHMPGAGVSPRIVATIEKVSPEIRVKLLSALGRRRDTAGLPATEKAARDADARVRAAAYRAMGFLGAGDSLDALLKGVKDTDAAGATAAEQALARIGGETTTRRLIEAYGQADDASRAGILRALGRRQSPAVARLVMKETQNPSALVRAAAAGALGCQEDPQAPLVLLEMARDGSEIVTRAAVNGYLCAARRIEAGDRLTAGRMFVEALKIAVTDEQRRLALGGIARHGDPQDAGALAIIRPLMEHGGVRADAANAAVKFAVSLPDARKDEAITILRDCTRLASDAEVVRRARDRLAKLGAETAPSSN